MRYPDSIEKLIHKFSLLPGVGKKTAARYAYFIIENDKHFALDFCEKIIEVKDKVRLCKTCFALAEDDECSICKSRGHEVICVAAYPKDVAVLEKAGFRGVYHILGGCLSPLEGRGIEDIRIKELLRRVVDSTKEIIVALNPDIEGDATALYLAKLIKPFDIKVTRLATGISMGSDIEYADEVTLSRAISQRINL
ncbi:MAG: recombination mediator RecR [Firmicutes bacterium]|nr:recombination mediator RecR [Bacillota bacterium]